MASFLGSRSPYTTPLTAFLTDKQIEQARKICREHTAKYKIGGCAQGTLADTLQREIIHPNIKAIDKKLGQENDVMYLAYLVEYSLSGEKLKGEKS